MISRADIERAKSRIGSHLRSTPVLQVEAGTLCDGGPLALKLEQLQPTGSFKLRGAFNAMLTKTPPKAGVVAFSGGNHGAAVAYAATKLGLRSTIFVPEFAGPVKIARMRSFGAEVIVPGNDVDAILAQYAEHAERTGALSIHPYDDLDVICGQGTLGLDIEAQLPDLDTLCVSVGGGGLIAGLTSWYTNRIKIVAVETEGTATLATALSEGADAEISPSGIAASALGAPRMGENGLRIINQHKPLCVVVSDADVIEAQKRLWDTTRLLGEPGAATALAAVTSGGYRPDKGERVGVLICGGNASTDWFLD